MPIKIALAGNPNSGKTTIFNALTGGNQYVGNWPGVTVEKKEGRLKSNKDVIIQDLPGIYSLSPYTKEEVVARRYLINDRPDVIINIVDAANIERNLYLTTQLIELGIPVIIVLNMHDVIQKRGDTINIKMLSEMLGCEVLESSAIKSIGTEEAAKKAISLVSTKKRCQHIVKFSEDIEKNLHAIQAIIHNKVRTENLEWYAVKLFERDREIINELKLKKNEQDEIEAVICNAESKLNDDSESIITTERYKFITDIVKIVVNKKSGNRETMSDKIDKIVTGKIFALPIFFIMMFLVYYISVSTIGKIATDWTNEVLFGDLIYNFISNVLVKLETKELLNSLILDGILGGVGAVLGFLPQIMVMFLCLAFLEDCGYMARIAFIMDKIFRTFGLSGKSFMPMLVSTGCGVPGIMATRTIENERERKITIITTTFMPCSAKLPIIALISGALFPDSIWIGPLAYFSGIIAIMISGIFLKKTGLLKGEDSPFIMELPAYHLPLIKNIIRHTWDRSKSFVQKAGTVILVSCVIIWTASTFNWRFEAVDADKSLLASLGKFVAPIFAPLGWGDWRAVVSTLTGIAAKENVVANFGVLLGSSGASENGNEYWNMMKEIFTTQTAGLSFLLFNLLCTPCIAAVSTIRKEMNSNKWFWFAIAYQTGFAYVVSFVVYRVGLLVV